MECHDRGCENFSTKHSEVCENVKKIKFWSHAQADLDADMKMLKLRCLSLQDEMRQCKEENLKQNAEYAKEINFFQQHTAEFEIGFQAYRKRITVAERTKRELHNQVDSLEGLIEAHKLEREALNEVHAGGKASSQAQLSELRMQLKDCEFQCDVCESEAEQRLQIVTEVKRESLEACTAERATEEEYLELQNQVKHIHGELDETQFEIKAIQKEGSMWEESTTSSWARVERSERAKHELMMMLSNMIEIKNACEVEFREMINESTETKEHEAQIINDLKHQTEAVEMTKKFEIDELQELLSKLEEEVKQKDVDISRQEEASQIERKQREAAIVMREKKHAAELQNLQTQFNVMKKVADERGGSWMRTKLVAVIVMAMMSCVVGGGLHAFCKRLRGSKRAQSVLVTMTAVVFLASDPIATFFHSRQKKL